MHKEYFSDFARSKQDLTVAPKIKIAWRFQDYITSPPKKAKGEAAKSKCGPDAKAIAGVKDELCVTPQGIPVNLIKVFTEGRLSSAALQAACQSEYSSITMLQNSKSIARSFIQNGLFDDIKDLVEGLIDAQ
ncbi:hypothetical protein [Shewanella sp. TC10]|uniref:hypothetical protein n=1 Tax=Shewanella sp. TC10 TaxID=1419739 RepID=UPI00129DD3FF|nr:hypothetical protein [Shewanella sp. TC10]